MTEPTQKNDYSTTFQKSSFLIYLLAVSVVFLYMLRNFLMPVFLAAIFTGLTFPFYQWILGKTGKQVPSALLTLLSLMLVLVLPIIAIGASAYQEAMGFFASFDLDM